MCRVDGRCVTIVDSEKFVYESSTAAAVCVSRRFNSEKSVLCVNDRCVLVVDRILFYRESVTGVFPVFWVCLLFSSV